MDASTIPLGSFQLLRPIGQGGMAQVWHAVHRVWDLDVAVKVLTGERARDKRAMTVFRREVQAVAALDHPGIIRIFDVGSVPAEGERASGGSLSQGSPFFAMELLSGNTLRTHRPTSWAAVRTTLIAVLEALAHAHARGVVHRDLKPDNVLVDVRDGATQLRISDFGIAHLLDASASPDEAGRTAGTPSYMAPEQLQAHWRDYGAWTDLYALGCLAYELVCGQPPFARATTMQTIEAHLYDPRPSLRAAFPVPDAFEGWLHQMLAVEIAHRFAHARDALSLLVALPGTLGAPPFEPLLDAHGAEPTRPMRAHIAHSDATPTLGAAAATSPSTAQRNRPRHRVPPEIPLLRPAHAAPQDRAADMLLHGAGLGLYGLRPISMVNRDVERSALWSALTEVCGEGRGGAVVLAGEPGSGKRRLTQWLAHTAAELGLAEILDISLESSAGPENGLARLFATHFGCLGLTRMEIYERLYRHLAAYGMDDPRGLAMAATQFMTPFAAATQGSDPLPDVSFGSAAARYSVARRLLGWTSRRRPLLLIVRHAQHGDDFLDFVGHVLAWQARVPSPVLFVLTCDQESGALRLGPHGYRPPLRRLLRRAEVRTIAVGRLGRGHHSELVERLLMLEPVLAERVAERTASSPLFAVQLVGDWVERGLLQPTTEGFALAGSEPPLPENIRAVWTARIAALGAALDGTLDGSISGTIGGTFGGTIDGSIGGTSDGTLDRTMDGTRKEVSEDIWRLLEIAAALGAVVHDDEWRNLARHCGVRFLDDLLDVLLTRGLAQSLEAPGAEWTRWSFSHPMLREVLEQNARDKGRWEHTKRAYVQLLRGRYDRDQPDVVDRLAAALFEAGDHEESRAASLGAAKQFAAIGEMRRALASLERYEDALMALDVPMSDPGWSDGWRARAAALIPHHALDEAQQALEQAAAHAHLHDSLVQAELASLAGRLALARGDEAAAMPALEDAIAAYHHLGLPEALAENLVCVAHILLARGDVERATMYFDGALELFEGHGAVAGMADALAGLAGVCVASGDLRKADELLGRAMSYAEKGADRLGLAELLRQAADVAFWQGDHEGAQSTLERSMQQAEELGARPLLAWAHATGTRWAATRGVWDTMAERLDALASLEDVCRRAAAPLRRELELASAAAEAAGRADLAVRARALLAPAPTTPETGWDAPP